MLKSTLQKTGVSIDRLLGLRLICEHGSIMAAAQQDPNKQSLLSRQVKELESALESELLDRTHSPAKPTNLAHKLSHLFTTFDEGLRREIETYSSTKTVRIGAGESVLQWLLIPLLTRNKNTLDLNYEFHNFRSSETIKKLKSGQIDIGIVSREVKDKAINSQHLSTLKMKLIGLQSNFLKEIREVDDLDDYSVAALYDAPIPESLSSKIKYHCTSYGQLLELAATPNTLAMVSEICSQEVKRRGLSSSYFPPLSDTEIQIHLVWNKSFSPPWLLKVIDLLTIQQ